MTVRLDSLALNTPEEPTNPDPDGEADTLDASAGTIIDNGDGRLVAGPRP